MEWLLVGKFAYLIMVGTQALLFNSKTCLVGTRIHGNMKLFAYRVKNANDLCISLFQEDKLKLG